MAGKGGSWALIAALAGFLFGFDTAVISGAEQAVQKVWAMSDALHGLAISSALWGTVAGALLGGWPSDRWGRRPTLIAIGVFYAISAIGSALAWGPTSFIIFRVMGGVAIGVSSVTAPAYIAEIAPQEQRGRLVALFQTMLVFGILIAFLSNYLLGGLGEDGWRWMLGVVAVPSLAYLVATFKIPESPRWLLTHQGREAEARAILAQINPATVDETLAAIATEAAADAQTIAWSRFFSGEFRRPIMLAFLIAFFNQLSGINAIIYYAPRIFELTGAGASTALLATVGIGLVNMVFTLAGLALIDRAGRKFLMYVGSVGYIVSLGMTAWGFASGQFALVLPFIFAFIAAHAIGQGAVIWVYISEIFPSAARAKGQSLGAGTHWVCAAALTQVMPVILSNTAPAAIFAGFALIMVLQLIWVRTAMIETSGRSLEDVAAELSTARVG
ncbi:MAG: MFS transporter [Novosphingobium sp. 28-62-57]|uniref:sugar porter family MFS transporter n=1 Tax=unclassified Novosphingobium TaxID=2644732 RepID=UPI000BC5DDC7|nr:MULTISPECIES: sugar porter family MFS transporter [unclassified Novosphingobium]OYW47959.1 MAG: MFS transporter [Novosphingobium sp. 12-63-9]OYZ10853.1 MAG: MFS transporter [Novosphingobium sp. 28-62-57]OZA34138.1 MAG: MFS transporter [Novosphingobium sp. 17-62-9]HQS69084.1 sugar porter family MFS transporter [Novosphingobium sp.]